MMGETAKEEAVGLDEAMGGNEKRERSCWIKEGGEELWGEMRRGYREKKMWEKDREEANER